ncbi:MAG: hypothetical protein UT84_C0007G0003 [Candidatus Curtissbacteria bacterium GW2011_GWA1_40_16]|uniref:Calcineurin-like phosphoesterase domain-containing protein n=1 Tax=Candidatus Curtissbacteria bacterium GW2011_GWA1_40_16 TaxID=1618405 RepID=A0A0G0UKF3_9BACT|nr:MAG: hypothetical protein UT84_C0007G0003 [Candidatus Curtissbacteria bacterium GW2011_GWA1_40_16]
MRKILTVIIVLASILFIVWAFFYVKGKVLKHTNVFEPAGGIDRVQGEKTSKTPILRFAMVADSENDNDLLAKALDQAKGSGVNFVIGLGDWSSVGTASELTSARQVFDKSGLTYYLTSGDHDLWDSRNRGEEALTNYKQVFGEPTRQVDTNGVQFVIVDNSDIYKGISTDDWQLLTDALTKQVKLRFVFAHKTPYHPQSSHIMGEDSPQVADQAQGFLALLEKSKVAGFFSGDLHFFAQYKSPGGNVKITTVGAINADRNSQGPRFSTVTVYNDYSWDVSDVEIR